MRDPEVFGRGLCVSGSWWWNEGSQVDAWRDFAGPMPVRLWIDVGANESREFTDALFIGMVSRAREVRELAVGAGMVLGEDLGYYEQPDGKHLFDHAALKVAASLEFLLSDLVLRAEDADSLELNLFETDISAPERGAWLGGCDLSVNLGWGERMRMSWPNDQAALSSSDDAIATVDATGRVTAVAAGTATISGELVGLTAEDAVEVH
jgi:hypothetical protein